MKKILIINDYYYPGWRSGGPQQTIMNFAELFGTKCKMFVLTHNHDMGESQPYHDCQYDTWSDVRNAKVYYNSSEHYSMEFLEKMINRFDKVYLCGPYTASSYKTLILNRRGKINTEVILAPMGSFSKGALLQKKPKKVVFWNVFKILGLAKNIKWSFSSEIEKREAIDCVGNRNIKGYYIAEDLPRKYVNYMDEKNMPSDAGELKVSFLSRICPQKNLLQAIRIVSKLKGNIVFDIYGTKEDETYWKQCEEALNQLPENVTWNYRGAVSSENVIPTFLQYEVFLFPTLGENFGHVIYEALVAGCIPIISNRTLWNDIEQNCCGHEVALEDEQLYVDCLQQYVDMDRLELRTQELNAMKYAEKKYEDSVRNSGYKSIIC